MGLRMKNFNIVGVFWKIWFLGGVHKKPMYKGKLPKKGELDKKEGVVFLREDWYPNAHYVEVVRGLI